MTALIRGLFFFVAFSPLATVHVALAESAPGADREPQWRYTANGWQDLSYLQRHPDPGHTLLPGLIHPVVWSLMMLLAVAAIAVCALEQEPRILAAGRDRKNHSRPTIAYHR